MDFHTDLLSGADLYDASNVARVSFTKHEQKGSRTRNRRFVFTLEGFTSNRRPNWGTGARDLHDGYAATWDEWGIFLNVLFQRDPEAHCGRYSYLGLADFRHKTNGRFDTLTHADQHINHNFKWDRERGASVCACGATRRHDNLADVQVVKHGIVRPSEPATVDRWLSTTPLQRAVERELCNA